MVRLCLGIGRSILFITLAAGLSMTARPSVAEACGHVIVRARYDRADLVAKAEAGLANGQFGWAELNVRRAFPDMGSALRGRHYRRMSLGRYAPIYNRAERIMAVVTVRKWGRVRTLGDFDRNKSEPQRRQHNLEWAEERIREALEDNPEHPALRTFLGEALTAMPTKGTEAVQILSGLEEQDLMVSSHGYVALAFLRHGQGDETGRDRALARCKTRAREPETCSAFLDA